MESVSFHVTAVFLVECKEIATWKKKKKKKIRKLFLTDESHKYLIERNAVEYNSFLSLRGMGQQLHPTRDMSCVTKATGKFFSYFVVIL